MIWNIITAIVLIIGWILASYGLVIKKAPDLKKEYDKIIPYQGFVGLILLIMWIVDFINIFNILWTFKSSVLIGLLWLATMFTKLILWFVLSFWLFTKYFVTAAPKKKGKKSKKAEADWIQKTNGIYNTLTNIQIPFGILAILLWFVAIILTIWFAIKY